MVPHTRRRLLQATAGLLAGLAGCGELPSDRQADGIEADRNPNVERDPERFALRSDDERPAIWLRPESVDESELDSDDESTPPPRARSHELLADEAAAARLQFADVESADDARAFVADTDFDAETLYLETRRVRECYRLELCWVTWAPTDVETQYGSYLLDADVDCSTGVREQVSWLIRIPDTLNPDDVNSHGSGWSSRGCPGRLPGEEPSRPEDPIEADPVPRSNATDTEGSDD